MRSLLIKKGVVVCGADRLRAKELAVDWKAIIVCEHNLQAEPCTFFCKLMWKERENSFAPSFGRCDQAMLGRRGCSLTLV